MKAPKLGSQPLASVVVLTHNPGPEVIREVLQAITTQQSPYEFEVLVIDSASTDGTCDVALEFDVRLVSIDPDEFQHGRTRNFAMTLARGEFVAFLTHDATPAGPHWLRELVEGFDLAPDVGAVFGRHLPRRECDPFSAREINALFAGIGPDDRPTVQSIKWESESYRSYKGQEGALGFFSDVNSCIRRSVWKQIPFPELDYAEDQRLGRDLLEAGYAKVYCPSAAVFHSHTYPIGKYFHRMVDEWSGLHTAIGYQDDRSFLGVLVDMVRASVDSARYAYRLADLSLWTRLRWMFHGVLRSSMRRLASFVAMRADRLPLIVVDGIGLERRVRSGSLVRRKLRGARRLAREEGVRQLLRVARAQLRPPPMPNVELPEPWALIDPDRPPRLLELTPKAVMTVNWIVPPFGVPSGGHMNIAHIINSLERRGHKNRIYLFKASESMQRTNLGREVARIRRFFPPMEAEIFLGVDRIEQADVVVATAWDTAYVAYQQKNVGARCYLVQDFEPAFFPVGGAYALAENTYRLGFHCMTLGPWLADVLRERYGAIAEPFDQVPDHEVYHPQPSVTREEQTIAVYSRWVSDRRGFELAYHALGILARRKPAVRIVLFGWNKLPRPLPFPHENLGVLDPPGLADLYRKATLGFVISLTNPAIVGFEMMACGLPAVDVDGESTRRVFSSGRRSGVALAQPFPSKIADALIGLLDDPNERAALSTNGREFVEPLTWERSVSEIERGMRRALGWKD